MMLIVLYQLAFKLSDNPAEEKSSEVTDFFAEVVVSDYLCLNQDIHAPHTRDIPEHNSPCPLSLSILHVC